MRHLVSMLFTTANGQSYSVHQRSSLNEYAHFILEYDLRWVLNVHVEVRTLLFRVLFIFNYSFNLYRATLARLETNVRRSSAAHLSLTLSASESRRNAVAHLNGATLLVFDLFLKDGTHHSSIYGLCHQKWHAGHTGMVFQVVGVPVDRENMLVRALHPCGICMWTRHATSTGGAGPVLRH